MLMLPAAPEPKLLPAYHRPWIKSVSHLSHSLEPAMLRALIPEIVKKFSRYDFDAIAFRGLSGALVAPIVAYQMGKTLLAVRRNGEACHSDHTVEGDYAARRYIILDDFISTGTTMRAIASHIERVMPDAKCIGVYEYLFPHSQHGLKQLQDDGRTWRKP